MYLNLDINYIFDYLKIKDKFQKWPKIDKNENKKYVDLMTITPREVNDRFNLFNKPYNTYCKENYLDFNYIVDKILQMSLPYSESKAQDLKYEEISILDQQIKKGNKIEDMPIPYRGLQPSFPSFPANTLTATNTGNDLIKMELNPNNFNMIQQPNFFKRLESIDNFKQNPSYFLNFQDSSKDLFNSNYDDLFRASSAINLNKQPSLR
jgi:hypothetical protein